MNFLPENNLISASMTLIPKLKPILKVTKENQNVITLRLPLDSSETPLPGQFYMLSVLGSGEIPISLSGINLDQRWIEHSIRGVGNASRAFFRLPKGAVIGVRGPFGQPWPINEQKSRSIIVIAGGIGMAPLMPILDTIARNRDNFAQVAVLYGMREPKDLLFGKKFMLLEKKFAIKSYLTVDSPGNNWPGHVGVVTHIIPKLSFDWQNTSAFICGPEVMMRFAAIALCQKNADENRIYVTMERNMKCAIGLCGHCQWGPHFVCKNGPVFSYGSIKSMLTIREL